MKDGFGVDPDHLVDPTGVEPASSDVKANEVNRYLHRPMLIRDKIKSPNFKDHVAFKLGEITDIRMKGKTLVCLLPFNHK